MAKYVHGWTAAPNQVLGLLYLHSTVLKMTKCLPYVYALCAPYQNFPKLRGSKLYWLLHCQLNEHQRTKQHPKGNIA